MLMLLGLFRENMEIVAVSSTHKEVSAHKVARSTVISYTRVRVALSHTLRCYPYKTQRPHELLPGDFLKRRAFAVGRFKIWRKMTIGYLKCCGQTKPISHSEGMSTPTTSEFGLPKILELSCKLHYTGESHDVVWIYHVYHYWAFFFFQEMYDSGFVTLSVTGQINADISHHPWLINTCWKVWFLCRMMLHPILLDVLISWACRLVMIGFWAAILLMRGLPDPHISVRIILGFRVTWSRKSIAIDRHQ